MGYNPFTLAGKTILVTGASSGIGRSVSIECSKMGAVMYITARNEQRLNETLSMMQGQGHKMIVADLCDEDSIIALVAGLPKLDGVVHNAGVGDRTLCKMVKESDINRVMSANFEGPVLLQKYLQNKRRLIRKPQLFLLLHVRHLLLLLVTLCILPLKVRSLVIQKSWDWNWHRKKYELIVFVRRWYGLN